VSTPHRGDPWFSVPVPKAAARLRLFCFPYAGGGASAYFPWSRALADRPIEVCAVQPPGRENRLREAPIADLTALIDALAAAIGPRLDRPYAFFGHSMGALVAFELTRRLRDNGAALPAHVFVSGARAPDVDREDDPLYPIEDDGAFIAAVAERYGGIPKIVLENAELRSLIVPALRADMTATESYEYKDTPPLPIDIAAYGGIADTHVSEERLVRWRDRTTTNFTYKLFDGDHFFLNDARDAVVADVSSRLLDRL
jgi:surfactin synthase thioesterase subunit